MVFFPTRSFSKDPWAPSSILKEQIRWGQTANVDRGGPRQAAGPAGGGCERFGTGCAWSSETQTEPVPRWVCVDLGWGGAGALGSERCCRRLSSDVRANPAPGSLRGSHSRKGRACAHPRDAPPFKDKTLFTNPRTHEGRCFHRQRRLGRVRPASPHRSLLLATQSLYCHKE